MKCDHCSKEFEPRVAWGKYCSQYCRVSASHRRKVLAELAGLPAPQATPFVAGMQPFNQATDSQGRTPEQVAGMPGLGALTESQINAQLELTIQAMKEHNRKQHEQMKELLNERGMLIAENRELKEKLKEAESNKFLNAIISRFAK